MLLSNMAMPGIAGSVAINSPAPRNQLNTVLMLLCYFGIHIEFSDLSGLMQWLQLFHN